MRNDGVRILVDSSIWIDHINRPEIELIGLLRRRCVVIHPMVVGEVALGSIADRAAVLSELCRLSAIAVADDAEVIDLIEDAELYSRGIGYVDAHLLAAARAAGKVDLWTRDKRLHAQAQRLQIAYVA